MNRRSSMPPSQRPNTPHWRLSYRRRERLWSEKRKRYCTVQCDGKKSKHWPYLNLNGHFLNQIKILETEYCFCVFQIELNIFLWFPLLRICNINFLPQICNLEEQLEQFREELENKNEEVQQLHMQLEIQKKEISSQQEYLETRERMLQVNSHAPARTFHIIITLEYQAKCWSLIPMNKGFLYNGILEMFCILTMVSISTLLYWGAITHWVMMIWEWLTVKLIHTTHSALYSLPWQADFSLTRWVCFQ